MKLFGISGRKASLWRCHCKIPNYVNDEKQLPGLDLQITGLGNLESWIRHNCSVGHASLQKMFGGL